MRQPCFRSLDDSFLDPATIRALFAYVDIGSTYHANRVFHELCSSWHVHGSGTVSFGGGLEPEVVGPFEAADLCHTPLTGW